MDSVIDLVVVKCIEFWDVFRDIIVFCDYELGFGYNLGEMCGWD